MRNEQILPSDYPNRYRSQHIGNKLFTRLQPRLNWSNWYGWRQWLVLFSMGIAVVVIEARNHMRMWQEHQSGQVIWTDPELIFEIVLFGFVFPLLAGLVLEYTGRLAIERDEISRKMKMRQTLVSQLHETQGWYELAELIVSIPGSVVSADRAWLFVQRAGEELTSLAQWAHPSNGLLPSYPQDIPNACSQCREAKILKRPTILTCPGPMSAGSTTSSPRYCLWLSTKETGKTALLIDMPHNRPLSSGQMKELHELGNEMSLAIENANLHYLNQRQGDIASNERQRIARDLHDTLGQNISYLRLKLGQLNTNWQDSGGVKFQEDLTSMLTVADEAYEQVRDTLEELRATEPQNLEGTVKLYAAQAAERAEFLISVHSSGAPGTLSARRIRQIMYILREAMNNVEKHANAQNVDIHLQWCGDTFILTVRDDGKGFNLEEAKAEDRYGLIIMGERSQEINAKLSINSTLGEGTEITVNLPLSRNILSLKGQ